MHGTRQGLGEIQFKNYRFKGKFAHDTVSLFCSSKCCDVTLCLLKMSVKTMVYVL